MRLEVCCRDGIGCAWVAILIGEDLSAISHPRGNSPNNGKAQSSSYSDSSKVESMYEVASFRCQGSRRSFSLSAFRWPPNPRGVPIGVISEGEAFPKSLGVGEYCRGGGVS